MHKVVTSSSFQASSSSAAPIQDQFRPLPREVIGRIFTLVKPDDPLVLKLVCKSFRAISEFYQKEIVISKLDISLVKRYPNLEAIFINNFRRNFNEANNAQLEALEKLSWLLIKNPLKIGTLSDALSSKVIYLEYRDKQRVWDSHDEIDKCTNLQTLVLRNCKIESISRNLEHLRCLEIDAVKGLNDRIMASAGKLSNLQLLSLAKRYKSPSADLGMETLMRINKIENLRVLCLDNVEISDEFVISLRDLKSLKILSLTNCQSISLFAVNFLFAQKIELMDFSNSVLYHQRGNFDSNASGFYNFNYHSLNLIQCGYYENRNVDIFQKINLTLPDDLLSIAIRHMKYLAPLIFIKDHIKSTCPFDFSAKLIQSAPFLSVTLDPTIFKIKEHALILLTTPYPVICGKRVRDCGVGVGSFVSRLDLPLRDDLEIIKAAISDGSASCLENLNFASSQIRLDFQSMLCLCKIDINALRYAHHSLQRELYFDLAKSARRSISKELGEQNALSFYPKLSDELASAIVERNGLDLQYLSLAQRGQPSLAIKAIKSNAAAIEFAFGLIHDFEFMKFAIGHNKRALSFLPDFFQRYYLQMFCDMSELITYANSDIQSDRAYCFWLIKQNCAIFEHLIPIFRDDEEIAQHAVNQYPQMSEFISLRLKQSLSFAVKAILSP